jgi:uncharacterized FAD-dependent dehydrogenase
MTFVRTFFLHYEVFSRKTRATITVAVPYAVCKQTRQLLPTRSALEHGAAASSTAVVGVERRCMCVRLGRHRDYEICVGNIASAIRLYRHARSSCYMVLE